VTGGKGSRVASVPVKKKTWGHFVSTFGRKRREGGEAFPAREKKRDDVSGKKDAPATLGFGKGVK